MSSLWGKIMPKPAILLIAFLTWWPVAAWAAAAEDAVPAMATEAAISPDPSPTLDDLLWVARPLIIFADTPEDPRFVQQMRMLEADPDSLADRNVVILTDADPGAKGPLRQRLRPRDFGVVLIDIDGSVAQRRPVPTSVREFINLIDRMPSRREETGSLRP